jgi:hypothetical protein
MCAPTSLPSRLKVARPGDLWSEPANRSFPDVPVGVNQPGDHQAAASVDHLCIRGGRLDVEPDSRDNAVGDEHVSVGQIPEIGSTVTTCPLFTSSS